MTQVLDQPTTVARITRARAPAGEGDHSGAAAALVVCGWILGADRCADPYYLWTSAALALAFAALSRPITRRRVVRRALVAAVQIVTALMVLFTADRAFAAWEDHVPRFAAASTVASGVLNVFGYHTAAERGLLFIDHPEGLVTMVPSVEKLELRAFLLLWLAWIALPVVRGNRSSVGRAIIGLAAMLVVLLARYVVLLAVYIEHDNVLSANSAQAALDLFTSPWITCFFVLVAALAADRAARPIPAGRAGEAFVPPRARMIRRFACAIAIIGAALGFSLSFIPVGREKAGRILIDDRFCGIWEPTARQLDTEWYGDFPTYSFTSLAEWLGKWYSVDANTTRPYDDDLLSQYDVLVIKTPKEPIPDAETAAIERFVRRGGGLLLVGDHTNLLGMGTHLNALSAKHGIRFRYDSVSDALTGGFVNCTPPYIGRHLGALHVEKLEFMTSCSLLLSGGAQTVLAADNCRREPHDYAGSSFFGRRGPHPEMEHGHTVLAGIVNVDRGRIAAFTDSTIWSSFAVFSFDREKLAMDLIRLLNREQRPYELAVRCAAAVMAVAAVLMGFFMVRFGMALSAVRFGLTGFWSGAAVTEMLHRSLYAWPEPRVPISEVTFLWQGGACAFPPVLGTPGSLPADRCFDTPLVSVPRLGLVPRVAYTFDHDLLKPETCAMFVVAPVNTPPAKTLTRLREFVRKGGSLIVLDDIKIGARGRPRNISASSTRRSRITAQRARIAISGLTFTSAGECNP
jgi:hypothetical protein